MKILSLTGILFILLVSVSCADDASTPSSKVENVLHTEGAQREFYTEHSHELLINHIFENKWTVAYYVQPECNFSAEQVLAIKDAIEGSLKRWLSPLTVAEVLHGRPPGHENSTFVDKFDLIDITKNYELVDGFYRGDNKHEGQSAVRKKGAKITKRLLSVFFYCGTTSPSGGGAHFLIRKVKRGDGNSFYENTIHIYIPLPDPAKSPSQAGSDSSGCWWWNIGSTGFSRFTLIHEIGHAMGLADTYYKEGYNDKYDEEVLKAYNEKRRKYFESFGDLEGKPKLKEVLERHMPDLAPDEDSPKRLLSMKNLGDFEPPSLMSCDYEYDNEPLDGNKAPRLPPDDFLGIIRAYAVYVMEKQD